MGQLGPTIASKVFDRLQIAPANPASEQPISTEIGSLLESLNSRELEILDRVKLGHNNR